MFSAADALYHATGGVPVGASPSQVVVVRDSLPADPARLWGLRRTDRRLDIGMEPSSDSIPIAYWPCDRSLPIGIGSTAGSLIDTLTRNGNFRPAAVLAMLRGQARRSAPAEDHVYFLLSIPHPAGGEGQLIGGRLERQKVLDAIALDTVRALPIDWCAVSDERAAVATRRDSTTPAAGFLDATVCLIGCGALGSWLAEFIVRAGARTVLLFDDATILGGLLVRQNYVEADLGSPKSAALAARLRAITDGVTVIDGSAPAADDQSHLGRVS